MAGLLSRKTDSGRSLDAALHSRAPAQRETVAALLAGGDAQASGVLELLRKHDRIHFDVRSVPGPDSALAALDQDPFDVLLLDDSIAAERRLDLVREVAASLDNPPVIVLCGSGDGNLAGQALEAGACDAVRKDSTAYLTLGRTVHQALLRYHRGDEERRLRAELDRLTVFDPLTGLHNHRFFMESLEGECSRANRYGSSFSVLMLDIDDFAACGARFGRRACDELLKRVAELFKRSVRETDTVSRCAADRFCILVPETDFDGAMRLGERLRFEVAARRLAPAVSGEPITISVGVGTPGRAEDLRADRIAVRCEEALQEAKDAGKNRVVGRRAPSPAPPPPDQAEAGLPG